MGSRQSRRGEGEAGVLHDEGLGVQFAHVNRATALLSVNDPTGPMSVATIDFELKLMQPPK